MVTQPDSPAPAPRRSRLWTALIDEFPFVAIVVLGLIGVSWASLLSKPNTVYWVALTPILAVICIVAGWPHTAPGRRAAMAVTQIAEWAAVLVAMWLMSISVSRGALTSNEAGLMLLTLLALGVFVSGLNLRSWKLCATGAFLALCVPVAAWVEHAALLLVLVGLALIGLLFLYWWLFPRRRAGSGAATA
ncbi:MAG: hypothetical protein JO288_20225 [Hyphomicrobiales bacterium]|nr:hypothetical protein [Hyphomicrobiales bacterium]